MERVRPFFFHCVFRAKTVALKSRLMSVLVKSGRVFIERVVFKKCGSSGETSVFFIFSSLSLLGSFSPAFFCLAERRRSRI